MEIFLNQHERIRHHFQHYLYLDQDGNHKDEGVKSGQGRSFLCYYPRRQGRTHQQHDSGYYHQCTKWWMVYDCRFSLRRLFLTQWPPSKGWSSLCVFFYFLANVWGAFIFIRFFSILRIRSILLSWSTMVLRTFRLSVYSVS